MKGTCIHGIRPIKDCQECNKKQINARHLRYIHKRKESNLKLIGDKCFICDSINHLCFHEIHGINHNYNTHADFYFGHPQDFIPLCYFHHKLIHALGELQDKNMIKVLLLVEQFKSSAPHS
jgi:hypothetical protein